MARWSTCCRARWCRRRRSTPRRAAISPKAMTPRSTRCAPPAARGGGRSPALEARYRSQTGIATLKIRHNNVLGFHIEVPARNADRLMAAEFGLHPSPDAGRRGPLQRARSARAGAAGRPGRRARARRRGRAFRGADSKRRWPGPSRSPPPPTRWPGSTSPPRSPSAPPKAAGAGRASTTTACFEVEARPPSGGRGRAEGERRALRRQRLRLVRGSRLWLVTGPNMGGKSTFLRQNALIILLAQAGSYVPGRAAPARASSTGCSAGSAPRTISRAAARPSWSRWSRPRRSSPRRRPRSFVILDEVGRGTSTYDGLAIAWAVVEAIHDRSHCRCLFATHYHELTRLAERLDALSLHHVRAREWKGDLVLLHEVADGPADRSYGIAVAKLAGLPPPVLARAKSVLAKLEEGRAATGGIAAGLDDLPLFAAAAQRGGGARSGPRRSRRDRARQPGAARGAGAGLPAEAAPGRGRRMSAPPHRGPEPARDRRPPRGRRPARRRRPPGSGGDPQGGAGATAAPRSRGGSRKSLMPAARPPPLMPS